ncbi:hypothetical protein [Hyphobacterium sp. CCMP332]|uniref:hypothetical protein n=1 Tax=Hyphobacterium sp. CCMP332 TaxID=2749086 RepID=UPI001F2C4BD0|nr:hypothetical protein [Hyphobacterium sp. CCMP332]
MFAVTFAAAEAAPELEAATAPDARSVAVGSPATVFATVMNVGDTTATNCRAETSYDDDSPTVLQYQTVNGSNQLTGMPDTPVDIPSNGQQGFLLAVTPNAPFAGTIPFVFVCDNGQALGRPGINDLYLTAEAGSPPDLVTILATPSGDGVLRIPTTGGANAAGGAVINIGSGIANVTARPVLVGPTVNTNVLIEICESNPATGACLAARAGSVDMAIGGTARTFSIFVRSDPDYGIPFYPEFIRVSVEFRDQGTPTDDQLLRGASSVAYTAPETSVSETAIPLFGSYAFRVRDEENDPGGRFQGDGIIAFDEDGLGLGYMPTRFGDQVVIVQGNYDLADANNPTFAGTFEYLQYITLRFNTGTGDLTFPYRINSGFRGRYVYQATQSDGLSAPSSRSIFSDTSRLMAMTRRGHSCPELLNAEMDDVYDAFLGMPPTDGQSPDFSISLVHSSREADVVAGLEYSVTPGVGGISATGGAMDQTFVGNGLFASPISGFGNLRLPDGNGGTTEVVTEHAFVADCTKDNFIVVVQSGSVGYTIHFRKRQSQEM